MSTFTITSTLPGDSAAAAFSGDQGSFTLFQKIHEGAMHNQDYNAFEETYRRCNDSVFATASAWKSTSEAVFLRCVSGGSKAHEPDYGQAGGIVGRMLYNITAIGETTKRIMRCVVIKAGREAARRVDGKVDQRAWICLAQIVGEFQPLLEEWAHWDFPTFSSQNLGLKIIAARATQRFGPPESGNWVDEEDWLRYFMQTNPDEWHWFDRPGENESDDWLVVFRRHVPDAYWWLDHEVLSRRGEPRSGGGRARARGRR
ncbi:hypothetical protein QBC37DRAFT_370518 [Rhypophila decipiens]|uniref:Uncharacterized protein n=1 Tax=Rhypophila decipiens TaxID=261697 RepID=A0AAN7BDD5_9PEZI|nr:hypothetical protein QBC37DRAFT_370518 [Rhypophila decipiens]